MRDDLYNLTKLDDWHTMCYYNIISGFDILEEKYLSLQSKFIISLSWKIQPKLFFQLEQRAKMYKNVKLGRQSLVPAGDEPIHTNCTGFIFHY